MRLPGTTRGQLCEKCDGKCPVCDSYVNPVEEVRICDECAFGNVQRCIVCGSIASCPAYFCAECTRLEKDRDGCPNILNLGSSRIDTHYEKRKAAQ